MEPVPEEKKIFEDIYGTHHKDHHGDAAPAVFDHSFPSKD